MAQKITCYNCISQFYESELIKGNICPFCYVPNVTGESSADVEADVEKEAILQAAESRQNGDFDQAAAAYGDILERDPDNRKARWGRLLCKYGVIYVEKDDGSKEYCITCRKSVESDITEEEEYEVLLSQAVGAEAELYRREGKLIRDIQQNIRSGRNRIYDIFICYKETDRLGGRTEDSRDAEKISNVLKMKGYRVFYGRETLKNMVGTNYEAAIFNAIENAKVMLVIASEKWYLTTPWVQREWKGFYETWKRSDSGKHLIPLYEGISPEADFPAPLNGFQGIDLKKDKLNGYRDLLDQLARWRNPEKAKKKDENPNPREELVRQGIQLLGEAKRLTDEAEPDKAERKVNEAKKCFGDAADAGNPDACRYLADLLYTENSEKSLPDAVAYYKKAAKLGQREAIYQLAFMYEIGIGVEKNKDEAEKLYSQAGEAGHNWIPAVVSK